MARRGYLYLAAFALIVASGGLVSCADSSDEGAHVTVTDSGGIRIVTTLRPEWNGPRSLDLPASVTSVPAPQSSSPLSRVLAAELLADGGIAVLDGLLEQVIVYDRQGQDVLSFGGQGEGPGEFLQAISVQEQSDGSLQIYDARLRRVSVFAPDGSLIHARTLAVEGENYPSRAWRLSDGGLLVWFVHRNLSSGATQTSTAQLHAHSGALVRLAEPGVHDTLLTALNSVSIREGEGQGMRFWGHPFGSVSSFAMDTDGSRVLFTTSASHTIDVLDLSGGGEGVWRRRFRFPEADGPIGSEELQARRDRTRRALADEGASSTTALDFLFDPELQPDLRPAFRKVLWGPDGSVWAQRFEPSGEESPFWWVVSEDGAFRGLVEMPERTDILAFEGEHLLLLRLDELDVPSVHLVPFSGLDRE